MKDGPLIATIAALIGDPARANMLAALMDGRALTVSELAEAAGVALPTASGHLARLSEAGLLAAEKQGRHRYLRLSGPDVAALLESLMGVAQRTGATRLRPGPKDLALRQARVCYDHLAGERGVELLAGAQRRGLIEGDARLTVTGEGRRAFADLGVDMAALELGRRPLCRTCLDWSERRSHLAGALGAALMQRFVALGWARRADGRVVEFSPMGMHQFQVRFATR